MGGSLRMACDRATLKKTSVDPRDSVCALQEYVDRFYNEKRSSAQAARVKQALSKKKALEKMTLLEDPSKLTVGPCAEGSAMGLGLWDSTCLSISFWALLRPASRMRIRLRFASPNRVGVCGGVAAVCGVAREVLLACRDPGSPPSHLGVLRKDLLIQTDNISFMYDPIKPLVVDASLQVGTRGPEDRRT